MKNITIIRYVSFCLAIVLLMLTQFNNNAQAQAASQPGNNAKEKIEMMRSAYISNALSLTSDEAHKLWPVYSRYQTELQGLRADASLSDLDRQERELTIKKKYNEEFKKILGSKAEQVYKAEKEFLRILIEKATGNRP